MEQCPPGNLVSKPDLEDLDCCELSVETGPNFAIVALMWPFSKKLSNFVCPPHRSLFFCVFWCVDGKACPAATALEEWRVCNDHPCTVFHWETSAWGPCIENVSIDFNVTSLWDVTRTCPVGVQIRKVRCMKSNSGPVISKRYVLGQQIFPPQC